MHWQAIVIVRFGGLALLTVAWRLKHLSWLT